MQNGKANKKSTWITSNKEQETNIKLNDYRSFIQRWL